MKTKLILALAGLLLVGCGAATWGNLSQQEISSWQTAGITVEEYKDWKEAKFTPEEAGKWHAKGIKVDEAKEWKDNKFTLENALEWKHAGKSISEAKEARAEGLEPITK